MAGAIATQDGMGLLFPGRENCGGESGFGGYFFWHGDWIYATRTRGTAPVGRSWLRAAGRVTRRPARGRR